MGVPGLYRNIIKNYTGIHYYRDGQNIAHLYIDFNPIIYNCYGDIMNEAKDKPNLIERFEKKVGLLEETLINRIINKLIDMICNVVKPTKSVYIAIDGPAPQCKMIKQRERRYKKIYEEELKQDIKRFYQGNEYTYIKPVWNTSNITPGTDFMEKLCFRLTLEVTKGSFSQHSENLMITFSDSYVPGEGEHKFLKNIEHIKLESDELICIFSNDADLIMLSNRFLD